MADFFDSPVVCNTGPILGLFRVHQVGLLSRMFPEVLVPRVVADELLQTPYSDCAELERELGTLKVVELELPPDPLLLAELDAGEASVIALARARQVSRVLMDERKGRRIASLIYGLEVKGTCGLLTAAKGQGLVKAVKPLLEAMKAQGYFLGNQLIEECLRQSGE